MCNSSSSVPQECHVPNDSLEDCNGFPRGSPGFIHHHLFNILVSGLPHALPPAAAGDGREGRQGTTSTRPKNTGGGSYGCHRKAVASPGIGMHHPRQYVFSWQQLPPQVFLHSTHPCFQAAHSIVPFSRVDTPLEALASVANSLDRCRSRHWP